MKCCICHKELDVIGRLIAGNNPLPYDITPGARCCDECNIKYVIPARMADIHFTPAVIQNRG